MLLSTLRIRGTLVRLVGRTSRIGHLLRFSSSSPLDKVDLRDPPPSTSSQFFAYDPTSVAPPPPPLLDSKTTTTSSSLPLLQRNSLQPSPHHILILEPSSLPRPRRSPSQRTFALRTTSSSFLSVLRDREKNSSSPRAASADLVALVSGEASLEVTSTKEEVEELARRLMEAAGSLEGGVDVASWIFRVTEHGQRDEGVRVLLYEIVHELSYLLPRINPRPHPDPILKFFLTHQARIRLSFSRSKTPLLGLLEVYARLYTQDRRRLDPSAAAPPPSVVDELESLRLQHLVAVRAIHQAMKEVDKDVFTVRSCTSLMNAYNHGRLFQDVEEIWRLMRSEGGVGINQRAVSVYFDACGFNGSLPRALAAWKDRRATGFELNENNYYAYQECLTRCGAWDELLVHLSEQQAQHLLDSSSTPPLTAPGLAAIIKLANQIVMHPRHRSLREVNWDEFNDLRAKMKRLVTRETWEEVEKILSSSARHFVDGGVKMGKGRRPDRERPQ